MSELQIPFPLKGIPLKPEMTGRVKVDETLIQTLSALCGWDGEARRLLTCALNGSLNVTSPVATGITNKVSTGDAEAVSFGDSPTTEVLILANPNNAGDVWVNIGEAAGVDTGWVLDAGDILNISLNNMMDLRLYIALTDDKVIILRTV